MINKEIIDKHFITMIPSLVGRIKAQIYHQKKKPIEIDNVIGFTYEHVIKNIDKIKEIVDMEKMTVNFIKQNIKWYNSQLNRMMAVNNNPEQLDYEEEIDDDFEIENKIKIEKWYIEKKIILSRYRNQETDKIKQIIYDCYFFKGLTSGVKLAKHLNNIKGSISKKKNFSHNNCCELIRNLKDDIRTFNNNNNNI